VKCQLPSFRSQKTTDLVVIVVWTFNITSLKKHELQRIVWVSFFISRQELRRKQVIKIFYLFSNLFLFCELILTLLGKTIMIYAWENQKPVHLSRVTGLWTGWLMRQRSIPGNGKKIFFSQTCSHQILGSPNLLFDGYESSCPRGNWLGHNADHLCSCNAEVKNVWNYTSLSQVTSWYDA